MKFRTLFIGLGDFGSKLADYNYSNLLNDYKLYSKINSLLTLTNDLNLTLGDADKKKITSLKFQENDYKSNFETLKKEKKLQSTLKEGLDHISTARYVRALVADGSNIKPNEYRIIIYFSLGDDISSISISHFLELIGQQRIINSCEVYLVCMDYELMNEKYERAYACLSELDYHISNMPYVVSVSMFSKYGADNYGGYEKEDIVPLTYSLSERIIHDQTKGFTSSATQSHRESGGQRVIYNSCGFSSLSYDKDKVWQKICDYEKHTYLGNLINTISTGKLPRSTITGPVNQFILNKSLDYLKKEVESNKDGNSLLIDIKQIIHNQLQSSPPESAQIYLDVLESKDVEYHNNEWQKIKASVGGNINRVCEIYKESLKKEFLKISSCEDSFLGVVKLRAFLNTLLHNEDDNMDGILIDDDHSFEDVEENQLIYFKKLYNLIPVEKRDAIVKQIVYKSDLKEIRKEILNCEQNIKNLKGSIVELDKSFLHTEKEVEVIGFEEGFFTVGGEKVNINGFVVEDFSEYPDVYIPSKNVNNNQNSVDLRQYLSKDIENQGEIGSCVTNAITSALEYISHRATGKFFQMSRLFLYYNARAYNMQEGDLLKDSGCSILNALHCAQNIGVCLESNWPYDVSKMNEKPSATAFVEAEKYKVDQFQFVKNNLNDMLSCLDEGYPFVFGLKLTKSFNQIGGLVPIPEAGDSGLGKHSNHAMLCVGYNKKEKFFIVRNSWGSEWGDGGYCYIPFDYMTSNDMMLGAFTIRSVDEKVNEIIKTNIWGDDLGYFKDGSHNQVAVSEMQSNLDREATKHAKLTQDWEKSVAILTKQNQLFNTISFRNSIEEKLQTEISIKTSEKKGELIENERIINKLTQHIIDLNAQLKIFLYKYIGIPLIIFILLLIVVFVIEGFSGLGKFMTWLAADLLKILSFDFSMTGFMLLGWVGYGLFHFFFYYYKSFQKLTKARKDNRIKDSKDRVDLTNLYTEKWKLKFEYYNGNIIYEEILPDVKTFIHEQLKGLNEFIDLIHHYRERVSASYRDVNLTETNFSQFVFPLKDHKSIADFYDKDISSGNLHLERDDFVLNHNMVEYLQSYINGNHIFEKEIETHFEDKKSRYINKYTLSNLFQNNYFNIQQKTDDWNNFLVTFSSPLLSVIDVNPNLKINKVNHVYCSNKGFSPFITTLNQELGSVTDNKHDNEDDLIVFRFISGFPAYFIEYFNDDQDFEEFFIYKEIPKLNRK